MNITVNLYLKPSDISNILRLKVGEGVKLSNGDMAELHKDGELEIEHYDEIDMRDFI